MNKRPGISKLDAKGIETVVVGYLAESKAYRLWKRGTKIVFKSRDIRISEENIIDEKEFIDFSVPTIENAGNESSENSSSKNNDVSKEMSFADNDGIEAKSEDDLPNLLPESLNVEAHGRGRPKIIRTGENRDAPKSNTMKLKLS